MLYRTRIRLLALVAQLLTIVRGWYYRILDALDAPRPICPGNAHVSVKWMRSILRHELLPKQADALRKVTITDLQGNRGLSGAVALLQLEYDAAVVDDADQRPRPKTLILKITPDGIEGRTVVIGGGRYRESWFYQSAEYTSCVKDALPKVHYAYGSQLLGEAVLVFENVNERPGAVVYGANFCMGNQVWGIPPDVKARLPENCLLATWEAMYTKTAAMHARFWRDKKLLRQRWLKGADWYQGKSRGEWEAGISFARSSWAEAKRKFAPVGGAVQLSPKLVEITDKSLANTSWDRLQRHLHDPRVPFTLCHGDFHAGNMLIAQPKPRSGKPEPITVEHIMFVDWSEVGPWEPAADIAQMVVSDVRPETFRKYDRDMVHRYWTKLVAFGTEHNKDIAAEYSFDQCYSDFARAGAERWIWMFALLSCMSIPAHAIQYFHDQVLGFLEAHGDRPFYELKPIVCLLPPE